MRVGGGEAKRLARIYDHYCENCSINKSCVAICRGKFEALVQANEASKYAIRKPVVRLANGMRKVLPFWS